MNAISKLLVRDFMTPQLLTLTAEMELLDAIALLVEKRVSGAPVLDAQGNLVGIVTERDCLARTVVASYHGEAAGRVAEVMSRDIKTVEADASIMDVAASFSDSKFRRYPVMDNNRLVGIISRRDVLRAVIALS